MSTEPSAYQISIAKGVLPRQSLSELSLVAERGSFDKPLLFGRQALDAMVMKA